MSLPFCARLTPLKENYSKYSFFSLYFQIVKYHRLTTKYNTQTLKRKESVKEELVLQIN